MMRFDKSHRTVVVTCSKCGNVWAAVADDIVEAAELSTDHENRVHGIHRGATQGYGIRYQRTRRKSET